MGVVARESTLITPEGCLTQRILFSHSPSPSYDDIRPDYVIPGPITTSVHTKHWVGSSEDYRILRAYFEAQTFEANQEYIAGEMGRVGDKGILILGGGPSSPLYSLVESYAGIERLTYDLCDSPAEVESAMDALKEAACRWYEVAATTPCDVIRCTEDLDTKLISPDLFRRHAVPALREYARICHAHDKLFVVHMCGHIRKLLADVQHAGADAIHCLTLPPTGNTSLSEARTVLAGHTAAMLRVDPDLLLHGGGQQIDMSIGSICEGVGDWHNVLMIIPCGRAPLGNIRRVIDQVRERGKWK
jgi:uroporphyrinogen-III decarboxylase